MKTTELLDFFQGDYFKLAPITCVRKAFELEFKNRPISEGLAIEPKEGGYVIAFVEYNKKEGDVEYRDIGLRTFDIEPQQFKELKKFVEIARRLILDANNFAEEEDIYEPVLK